ncbi:glycosyltransferase family 2 protein [Pseudoxanthomonas dokdonensis]|uniref:Glycosyl transferase n=1 Tax=Pseudoxanthomonas dokdonensis TaxID=344882 RepID=A0A0R0CNQ3_9GAMM|nr:glycosyltransferase family 2 protein [Pseudoxanthomonas dokdonensis]KRG71152.1 glycosyl transferase [Pseudoxanthomonas dokdonensis]
MAEPHASAATAVIAVIPVFDHEHAIAAMVDGVLAAGLNCIVVDDGSGPACAQVLDALAARHAGRVRLLRLARNSGKGGAVLAGFRKAGELGVRHVLQIDADGQHRTADIPRFLQASVTHPHKVICGTPVYDDSVPKGRLYGRYLTHVWVWINTLSLQIRDSMCGFRIYPLAPVLALIEQEPIGQRMDFDVEIIVRLHWRGVGVLNLPTRVTYPSDGVSHFDVWADNVRISWMHTRLFFGMLRRLPRLLARRVADRVDA